MTKILGGFLFLFFIFFAAFLTVPNWNWKGTKLVLIIVALSLLSAALTVGALSTIVYLF